MKVGDVCYQPCMAGFHWLRLEVTRIDEFGDGIAEITHDCRGIHQIEWRRLQPENFEDAFTPDLPLPAFAHCWRCGVALFQNRNVGRSVYAECCEGAWFLCTRCDKRPWPTGNFWAGSKSFEDWVTVGHRPRCGRRCADCQRRVNPMLVWRCVGYGLAEQSTCAPTRCDTCYLLHKDRCTESVCRRADHRCPECDHSAIEVVTTGAAPIRRCTWCKAEWPAYYQNDKRFAWGARGLLPGETP
jgi:hypothetical protein